MKRIRVAMLVGGLDPGGTERQLVRALEQIDRTRFEPAVIALDNQQRHYEKALEMLDVRVLFVPLNCRGRLRRLLFLVRTLRQLRAETVHSWSFFANAYAGIAGRLAGVPRRFGSLRSSWSEAGVQSLSPWMRRLCLTTVDRLVVNSRQAGVELTALGIPEGRWIFIPNAVESTESAGEPIGDQALETLGLRTFQRLIGAVGNLRRVKNHSLLLRALAPVLERHPDAGAVIVGGEVAEEKTMRQDLEQLRQDLGLEGRVVFAGFQRDVEPWLRRFEIFCHPSTDEGMPNAVLEAMQHRLPVVATRVGELPELLDGAGLLVDPGDVDGLTQALNQLLGQPDGARRLGETAAERIRTRYAGAQSTRQLEALYQGEI